MEEACRDGNTGDSKTKRLFPCCNSLPQLHSATIRNGKTFHTYSSAVSPLYCETGIKGIITIQHDVDSAKQQAGVVVETSVVPSL